MFIDHSKVFACLDHEKLQIVLKEMSIAQHLIVPTCNLNCGQEATVTTDYGDRVINYRPRCQTGAFYLTICLICTQNICKIQH